MNRTMAEDFRATEREKWSIPRNVSNSRARRLTMLEREIMHRQLPIDKTDRSFKHFLVSIFAPLFAKRRILSMDRRKGRLFPTAVTFLQYRSFANNARLRYFRDYARIGGSP